MSLYAARTISLITLIALAACTTPSIIATQTIQRGDAANNKNNYDEAIKYYEEYLGISPQLGLYRNSKMESEVMRKLAHAFSTQGKYSQAIQNLKKAIVIDSVGGNLLEYVEDYRQLGVVYGYAGNYHSALRNLDRSLVLNDGMEKSFKDVRKSSVADTYMSLSQTNLSLGNYGQSKKNATKAFEIYSSIKDEVVGLIEAELILGIIERELGELSLAEELIEKSRVRAQINNINTARHNQAIGEIFLLKGDPENAIRFKLQAVKDAEETSIKPQMITAYMRLGDAYQRMGDQSRARFYYQKAMSIQAEMDSDSQGLVPSLNLRLGDIQKAYDYHLRSGSELGLALVSLRLGEQYSYLEKPDSAVIMFDNALKLFIKIGSKEGQARVNLEKAKISANQKLFSEADRLLRTAEKLTIQPDLTWRIFLWRGIVSEGNQAFDSAMIYYKKSIRIIDDLRSNISIEEFKSFFASDKVEVYDRIIRLLLRDYQKLSGYSYKRAAEESFLYNEQSRSRSFLDMMGNHKIGAKNVQDKELLEQEQLLKLKIQQLVKELNGASESGVSAYQLNQELEKTRESYSNLLHEVKLKNEAYNTMITVVPPSLAEIQSSLDEETAVVEYWISEESLAIWAITKSEIHWVLAPFSKKNIRGVVNAARKGISLQLPEVAEKSLRKLNEYLIDPISKHITGYKHLVIIPHSTLHFLPFQALQSRDSKFLIERFVLSYAPSSSVLHYVLGKKSISGNSVLGLALGDIAIGNFASLPGTELELDQLSKIYPHMDSQSEHNCSETYLKNNGHNQAYIHLATHGVLNVNQPLYSYLLMSASEQDDGQLTVNEIFNMNLQCKLVMLSACDTGLGDIGDGDDLIGLSRAFVYAGSQGVIVSLWQVDDATTAWLMTRFHQYMNAGDSGAEALAFAQRDIIQRNFGSSQGRGIKNIEMSEPIQQAVRNHTNNATARNPYFWAPFVLIGNGFIK